MEKTKIFTQLNEVMKSVNAIGKERKNKDQGFMFRGIDDAYNMLHPLFAKHSVVVTKEVVGYSNIVRTTKSGSPMNTTIAHYRFTFHADDGSSVSTDCIGEGADLADKASNKSMAIALKYALMETFLIPTEDLSDPDEEDPQASRKTVADVKAEFEKLATEDERKAYKANLRKDLFSAEEVAEIAAYFKSKKAPAAEKEQEGY